MSHQHVAAAVMSDGGSGFFSVSFTFLYRLAALVNRVRLSRDMLAQI